MLNDLEHFVASFTSVQTSNENQHHQHQQLVQSLSLQSLQNATQHVEGLDMLQSNIDQFDHYAMTDFNSTGNVVNAGASQLKHSSSGMCVFLIFYGFEAQKLLVDFSGYGIHRVERL